jgi:hypothetical protein
MALMLVTACLDSGPDAEVDESADSKEDGVTRPLGTYVDAMERTDDSWGGIYLSLMSDRSFRREEDIDPFVGPTIDRGTYRFTKVGTRRFIKLTFEDGSTQRHEYVLSGSVLKLRLDGAGSWASYEHEDLARCDSDEDCVNQGFPDVDCYYSACAEVPEPDDF